MATWGWPQKGAIPVHTQESFGIFQAYFHVLFMYNQVMWAESFEIGAELTKTASVCINKLSFHNGHRLLL